MCGTSLATPLFAGLVALADQRAGRPLGLLNPALYQMAAAHVRGIADIRQGNDTARFAQHGTSYTVRGFPAAAGYDLVSGIGTVNAAYFVPELARLATTGHTAASPPAGRSQAVGLGMLGEQIWENWLTTVTGWMTG